MWYVSRVLKQIIVALNSFLFSESKKDNVWGRKDWFGEDNKPKEEFFNIEDYV